MTNSMQRKAKASDAYVREILAAQRKLGSDKLSTAQKRERLASMNLNSSLGRHKLAQSMIGPIQLKLRYQGLLRNVLVEDALTPGVPIEYDVMDDRGQAYMLHGNEGEVKITPFEGKRLPVTLFRIAAFPQIKKEDVYYLRTNAMEYAQDEAKQAIMKQEDSRLVTLFEASMKSYLAKNPMTQTGEAFVNNVTFSGDHLTPNVFYDAVANIEGNELEAKRILFSTKLYRDLYRWDINTTGWAFKDKVVAGEKVQEFGEFQIGRSVIIPPNTAYMTPAPEFLGVFPVMYSLDVEEDNNAPRFHYGWVMDELVGMAILNPRGLVKISKA